MSDNIEISELLKPDFSTAQYYPVEENIDDKSEEVRNAWKEIYGFAYMMNQKGTKYDEGTIHAQTALHCQKIHGLTADKVRKIFEKVFNENKDEFGIDNKPEWVKVELYLKRKWEFIFNEVTQTTEFRPRNGGDWRDVNHDTIFRQLQIIGFKFGLDKVKSLLKSDFVPTYNPFFHHFENLAPWDGVTDHIDSLASFVTVTDQEFFKTQFKKTLVRCIACSLFGIENRIVFTFYGEKQSTGKSTFIRNLSPMGTRYYTEAPIRNNKDSEFAFAENFIYNIEELQAANNIEINRLKSIISLTTIKERKAYAVNATQQPRRCNFFGSSNKREFLTDTENTRWLIFEIVGIDWQYKQAVDIDKVWAQAFALYKAGFDFRLTKEEADRREAINKNYEVENIEKARIKSCFQVVQKGEGQFMPNDEILQVLQEGTNTSLNSRVIGTNMSQLGFVPDEKKINGHKTRGWWVKYIHPNDRIVVGAEEVRPF